MSAAALAEMVATLAVVATLILGVAWVAMGCCRSPIQRKRLASTALLVFLGWAALAPVPAWRPLGEPTAAEGATRRSEPVPVPLPSRLPAAAIDPAPVSNAAPPPPAIVQISRTVAPGEAALALSHRGDPDDASATQATAAAIEAAGPSWAPMEVVAVVWAIGAWLALGYLILAWAVLRRRIARSRPAPRAVMESVEAHRGGVRGLRVLVTDAATRPFCFGLRKPTIVLPAGLGRSECRQRLRAVLLHELAHIRERDLRDQALLAVALPLLYWHPLFWMLRHRLRLAAEMVADARATEHVDRRVYVRELIELVRTPAPRARRIHHLPLAPVLPVLGLESEFYRRMNMLLETHRSFATQCSPLHTMVRRCGAAAVFVLTALSWGAETLPAQRARAVQEPAAPRAAALGAPAVSPPKRDCALTCSYDTPLQLEAALVAFAGMGFETSALRLEKGEKDGMPSRFDVILSKADGGPVPSDPAALDAAMRRVGVTVTMFRPIHPKVVTPAPAPAPVAEVARAARTVSLVVTEVAIGEVVDSIAKQVGANVVISPDVKGTVTMRLEDVSWRSAIQVSAMSLGYVVMEPADGILLVTTPAAAKLMAAQAHLSK